MTSDAAKTPTPDAAMPDAGPAISMIIEAARGPVRHMNNDTLVVVSIPFLEAKIVEALAAEAPAALERAERVIAAFQCSDHREQIVRDCHIEAIRALKAPQGTTPAGNIRLHTYVGWSEISPSGDKAVTTQPASSEPTDKERT